jgi:type III restriction enzyme
VIPYGYMDVDHSYEPDFLVRLATPGPHTTLILEVKGFEDDRTKAKHGAAKRWIEAANNWGKLGRWMFHVCHNPQTLDKELAFLTREAIQQKAA